MKPIDLTVAALAVGAAAIGAFALLPAGTAVFGVAFACLVAAAAAIDVAEYRLPDGINAAIAVLGLTWLVVDGADPTFLLQRCAQALATGIVLALFRAAFRALRGRQGLGLGDVKLAAAGAIWTSPEAVIWAVLLGCVSALLVALLQVGRTPRDAEAGPLVLPFGAFLAPAFWLTWFAQQGKLVP